MRKINIKENRKSIKSGVSLEKIAYYVKMLYKKDSDVGKIILVIKSHFCEKDLRNFADKYKECSNDNNVRYIANLLVSVPSKSMDKYLQRITS